MFGIDPYQYMRMPQGSMRSKRKLDSYELKHVI